jgi:haloacetate dehalogenase
MSEERSRPWFDGFTASTHHPGLPDLVPIHARIGGTEGKPPLLLIHGFPQTGALWHRVAQALAADFHLVIPDLRGYGRSGKPPGLPDHANYAKRVMATDLVALMHTLGHASFFVAGHDRGARVAHRMALDHPDAVQRLALLDIAPTLDMYERTDLAFATAYYHWFFLIQPAPHPERMIGADPVAYLRWKTAGWGAGAGAFREPEAVAEYEACYARSEAIHASCEDYRAAATIDLVHDRASRAAGQRIGCDTLVLWGARGVIERLYEPLELWQAQCSAKVTGHALPCGHYLPEEEPAATAAELAAFFGA